MTIGRVLRAWDQFLFRPISPVPIALYRIMFGALVLIKLAFLFPDRHVFFGDEGVFPLADSLRYSPLTARFTVLAWLPRRPWTVEAVFAVALVAAGCLTAGFLTRLSAAVVWICLVSLHYRNALILNSGDAFLRLVSFYLVFSAAGRALSVDRWLRVRRGAEPPGPPPPAAPWAQRLIQLQLALVYLATVYWKLHGHTWVHGTAVYYASRIQEYARFPVPYLFDHLWTIKLLTWGTLAVEFAMAVLVWFKDLRYPVLLVALTLHLGLEYSMNIQLFQWLMITAFVLFIDPEDLRRAIERVTRRRRAAATADGAQWGSAEGG